MYELTIRNIATGEETMVFGYDQKDAFRRAKLDLNEWVVETMVYVD